MKQVITHTRKGKFIISQINQDIVNQYFVKKFTPVLKTGQHCKGKGKDCGHLVHPYLRIQVYNKLERVPNCQASS